MRIDRSRFVAFFGSAVLATTLGFVVGKHLVGGEVEPPVVVTTVPDPPALPPSKSEFWESQPTSVNLSDRILIAHSLAEQSASALPGLLEQAYDSALAGGESGFDFRASAVLVCWAEQDAAAAMLWAEELKSKADRESAQKDIVILWGISDSEGLGNWLLLNAGATENRSKRLSEGLRRIAFTSLGKSDPVRAISVAGEVGGTQFFGSSLAKAIDSAEVAEAAAMAAMSLDQDGFTYQGGSSEGATYRGSGSTKKYSKSVGPRLLDGIAERWDSLDPTGYADAVAAGRFRPVKYPDTKVSLAPVADETIEQATERALARASTPADRRATLFAAIEKWAVKDPDAAGTWLGQQDVAADPETWPAVRSFARTAAKHDPDGALAWIEQIGDAKIRSGAFIDAATAWGRAHPTEQHDTSSWPPKLAKAWGALSATAED